MPRPPCSVGGCSAPASRRLEIRRELADEVPAEVRPLCDSVTCEDLAMGSAAGFHRTLIPVFDSPPPEPAEELRVAKIRRGLDRLRGRLPTPIPSRAEVLENRRRELEAADFPEGLDYEAMILEEDEENTDPL